MDDGQHRGDQLYEPDSQAAQGAYFLIIAHRVFCGTF